MAESIAVGLMSGTSLDGIDAGLVRIYDDDRFELLEFLTKPYTAAQRAWLLSLCDPSTSHVEAICRANMELGELFASLKAGTSRWSRSCSWRMSPHPCWMCPSR